MPSDNEIYETRISCPYCGEPLSILVDTTEAGNEYIEDCQVCCRPIVMNISADGSGVEVRTETD